MTNILEIENLSIAFRAYRSFFSFGSTQPIENLSLELEAGRITAVVGQSGSGKSLVAHAVMDMLPENAEVGGLIRYAGRNLDKAARRTLPAGEIAMIPQSINYLDQLMRVGRQIKSLARGDDPDAAMRDALARYNLPESAARLYPFELSGGMARRVLIACAVVRRPKLILADEPTPGLDAPLVEETIEHLLELRGQGVSILLITHDLYVARRAADRIVFFRDGRSVCEARREDFADRKRFGRLPPYAAELFAALPENDFIGIDQAPGPDRPDGTLEAKAVDFAYNRSRKVLDKADFTLKSGEIVGLSGPSGQGKTTLCKLLAGYLRPDAGEILLDGRPHRSAYLGGGEGCNPVQLIMQHPEKAVDPKWPMRRILEEPGPADADLRERMGLKAEWMRRWPKELSGGELQRFAIARALNPRTRFLIADEITTMFDACTQAEIWKVVVEFARKNRIGMIVISHDMTLLRRLCDRIVAWDRLPGGTVWETKNKMSGLTTFVDSGAVSRVFRAASRD